MARKFVGWDHSDPVPVIQSGSLGSGTCDTWAMFSIVKPGQEARLSLYGH